MAEITHKDINLLTQKASVAGTEKIPVSDTEYITPEQIAALGGGGSSITVDSALSSTSTNPVQNKVIYSALGNKQDVAKLSLVGSGSTYSKSTSEAVPVVAEHIYRFTPSVKEWAHTQTSATNTNALVIGYRVGTTETILYTLSTGTWQVLDYYDVKIPSGVSGAHAFVGGRADTGTTVVFDVEDVTELFELTDELITITSSTSGSITATGPQHYVFPCGIQSGKSYVLVRTFNTPYPQMAGSATTSSGLRIWTTFSSDPNDTVIIDSLEQVFYNSAVVFKAYDKFTATGDASYIHVYLNPNSTGYTFNFSFGQFTADAVSDLRDVIGDVETLLAAL